jgi:3-carboxy-cis,cis-muconate cycloisomerase
VTPLDSTIFGPLFSDADISDLFTDRVFIHRLVEVEIALARVEAKLGLIPKSAAEAISQTRADGIDPGALTKGTVRSGFPLIALVEELRRQTGPDAAPYVHWGATTQDIMDTGAVLQMRAAIEIFKSRIAEMGRHLSTLADRHRATVMAGRTHSQQALPVTFGLKAAAWLAPFVRHEERLEELSRRLLVVQFGGAAGTLAALGDKGPAITKALADELGLTVPLMPWHAQRDSLAEFASWLSLVTGTLGKMAQDVILLAQTEVAEAAETAEEGRGGSSTMPQKRNPIASELILAAARMNAALLSAMHNAQIQEHERGTHGWQVEWVSLPQMITLTSGALKHGINLAENLQVDEGRMRDNIGRGNDLILAEAAVFALASVMPRSEAEEYVKRSVATALAQDRSLIEIVREITTEKVAEAEIDWQALSRPENYLGETCELIDAVLTRAKKTWSL